MWLNFSDHRKGYQSSFMSDFCSIQLEHVRLQTGIGDRTHPLNVLIVIFDSSLTMSNHNSFISKSCFLSIRDRRRIRSTLDFATAKTITTYLIHTKVDYCNSLFLNLPHSQLDRLQLVLNSAASAVSRTPVLES